MVKQGRAVTRVLGVVGEGGKLEPRLPDRPQVEADADRMALAEGLALQTELVAQADVETVRQNNETRDNGFTARCGDGLRVGAGRESRCLGLDEADARRDLGPNRVHQRRIEDAFLIARPHFDHAPEAGDPRYPIRCRGAQYGIREPGLPQHRNLIAIELFAAEFGRILRPRIDQDGIDPGTAQHGRRERSRKPATHDGNVGLARACRRRVCGKRPLGEGLTL